MFTLLDMLQVEKLNLVNNQKNQNNQKKCIKNLLKKFLTRSLLKKLKKQHLNYLFKLIINLFFLRFNRFTYFFSRISAYYKFIIKN